MFSSEVKLFVRKLKEENKERIQRQENMWNRFYNSVKALALMLICATMKRLYWQVHKLRFLWL